ncbi:unnamed protein product [Ixodes hexagonus]
MDRQRRAPFYQLIDGTKHSPFLIPAIVRKAQKYTPRDGDITVVSYPKSGTHWTSQIIQLILYGGQSASSFLDLVRRTPYLENHGSDALEGGPSPRVMSTQLRLLWHNFNYKAKYVYVARNPWDTCVSLYHYVRGLPKFQFEDGTFDDFFDVFMTGDFCYGNFFDHVLHGYARKDDPNVLFLTYEELKADIPGMVLKLAHFLGEEYGKALEGNQELFQEVLKKSSFDFMSRSLEPGAEELSAVFEDLSTASGKCHNAIPEKNGMAGFRFFRKGKVNDWKVLFSPEQIQRMQARIDQVMAGTYLMSLWSMK